MKRLSKSFIVMFSVVMLSATVLPAFAQGTTIFRFNGKVKDAAGNGIADVVVNDGIHFVTTDAQGAWILNSDTTQSSFVVANVWYWTPTERSCGIRT